MDKYGRWKITVEVDKTKVMQLSFGKKSSVSKVVPCGVCGKQVGYNSIKCRNCQSGFIIVVLMCLGRRVYYCVGMSLSVEHVLVIIVK